MPAGRPAGQKSNSNNSAVPGGGWDRRPAGRKTKKQRQQNLAKIKTQSLAKTRARKRKKWQLAGNFYWHLTKSEHRIYFFPSKNYYFKSRLNIKDLVYYTIQSWFIDPFQIHCMAGKHHYQRLGHIIIIVLYS